MSADDQLSSTAKRAHAILALLPTDPFTIEEFLAARREAGLGPVGYVDDVARVLHYLIDQRVIRRLEDTQPSLWVRTELEADA